MLESASNLGKALMIKKPTPDPHTSLLPSPHGSSSILTPIMWARGCVQVSMMIAVAVPRSCCGVAIT